MGKRIRKKLKMPGLYDLPLWYDQVELLFEVVDAAYRNATPRLELSQCERDELGDIWEDLHDIVKAKSFGITSILPQLSCTRCKCNYCTNAKFDDKPPKYGLTKKELIHGKKR